DNAAYRLRDATAYGSTIRHRKYPAPPRGEKSDRPCRSNARLLTRKQYHVTSDHCRHQSGLRTKERLAYSGTTHFGQSILQDLGAGRFERREGANGGLGSNAWRDPFHQGYHLRVLSHHLGSY